MNSRADTIETHAQLFNILGNSSRLKIVLLLRVGPLKVGDISRAIEQSQSSTSQHLAVLRSENIVSTTRSGNEIFYHFNLRNQLDFVHWEKLNAAINNTG